jgi:hypothetical protein
MSRQHNRHGSAATNVTGERQQAFVLTHDSLHQTQTKAGALRFGAIKRRENPLLLISRNTAAIITNRNF